MINIRSSGLFDAVAQTLRAGRRTRVPGRVLSALALVAGAVAAFPAPAAVSASGLAPESLARARAIRVEVNARYRRLPGRRLFVTEASTTGVVASLTLLDNAFESWRVVPAENGIYFAICSARARCPYPARAAAWRARAFLPRRQALELALRTFMATSVSLVVVALPTREPLWVVFERDDFSASIDGAPLLDLYAGPPSRADTQLRELTRRLTEPRLFVPLPILPPPRDTIYAVRPFEP